MSATIEWTFQDVSFWKPAAIHERLILWGQVLLQGAKGTEPAADDREAIRRRIWTAREEAAAWALDRLVNALEPKQRIVLRVFYKAREAAYWHELEAEKQQEIEAQLCREINARWRAYCAEVQQLVVTVRAYQVDGIRQEAIRELSHLPLDKGKTQDLVSRKPA